MRDSLGHSHLWFSAGADATAFEGTVVFSVTTLFFFFFLLQPSLPPSAPTASHSSMWRAQPGAWRGCSGKAALTLSPEGR